MRKTTKIDLHVHTLGSDGWGTPANIVRYAKAAKLDGVCLTDHHKTYTAESLDVARALRAAGLLAFHGCEYSTAWGHLLVFGVNVELYQWGHYPDPRIVIRDVRAAGGVCIPSHPYVGYKRRFGDRVKSLKGIAGIEVANGQAALRDSRQNKRAVDAAKLCKLISFGGSDAHDPALIGVCYTQFDAVIQTERDLIKAMKAGLARAVTSQKRIQEAEERRSKLLQEAKTQIPITALLPGVTLDTAPKSVQVSLDGHQDGLDWWRGDPSTTPH